MADTPDTTLESTVTPSQPPPATTSLESTQPWMQAGQNTIAAAARPARLAPQPTAATAPAGVMQTLDTSRPPMVLTEKKRGGLMGVLDEVGKWLAGTQGSGVYVDQEGNEIPLHPPLTHAQQWQKVGLEAMTGAAAGLKAGRGQGPGAAGVAGIQSGLALRDRQRQEQKEDLTEQRQARLNHAANVMQNAKLAEMALVAKRTNQLMTKDAIELADTMRKDYLSRPGTVYLGHFDTDNLHTIAQKTPNFFAKHFEENGIRPVPETDTDGKVTGFSAYYLQPGQGQTLVSGDDATIADYQENPDDPLKMGKIVTTTPSGLVSKDMVDNARAAAFLKRDNDQKRIDDAKYKQAQTEKEKSESDMGPLKVEQMKASIAHLRAETIKTQRTTPDIYAQGGAAGAGGAAPPGSELSRYSVPIQNEIKAIANYTGDPKTFSSRAAKTGMDRATAVGLARELNPKFDEGKWPAVTAARKDFTTGKTSTSVVSLNQAIHHLGQLLDSADSLNNKGLPVVNWFRNVGKTAVGDPDLKSFNTNKKAVVDELASVFKATGVTDISIKQWEDVVSASDNPQTFNQNIGKLLDLLKGRIQALDFKWEQATQDAGDRDIQLLSPESRRLLHSLGADDVIDADIKGASQEFANAPATRPAGLPPAPAGMVTVQIPGMQPQNIPQDALQKFKAKYPDGKVY